MPQQRGRYTCCPGDGTTELAEKIYDLYPDQVSCVRPTRVLVETPRAKYHSSPKAAGGFTRDNFNLKMRICGQRERAFRCRDGCKIRLRVWEFLELARNQLSERAIADVERDVLREKGVRTFDDLACKHDGPGPPAPSVLRTQHATTPVTPSRRPGQLSTTTRVATAGEPVNVYDISNDSSDSDHGSASPSVNANRNRGQEPSSSGPSTAPVASAQSASTSSGAHQTAARSPADSATDRFTHTAELK
jgi:hypothetical protein